MRCRRNSTVRTSNWWRIPARNRRQLRHRAAGGLRRPEVRPGLWTAGADINHDSDPRLSYLAGWGINSTLEDFI